MTKYSVTIRSDKGSRRFTVWAQSPQHCAERVNAKARKSGIRTFTLQSMGY